jgi:hypothetical protein
MRIKTVREFRDNATRLLRSKSPILVTRGGRLAGVFPWQEESLPLEFKKELFSVLSAELVRPPVEEAEDQRGGGPGRFRGLAKGVRLVADGTRRPNYFDRSRFFVQHPL